MSAENTLRTVVLVGLIALFGSARADASDDKLTSIVDKYLAARQATMLQASTTNDVDVLLAFYTEDIIYEHPRVKMRIDGRATIREGMARFLGATKDTRIVTINRISGVDMVVAEYRVTFKAQEGSSWKDVSRTQVTLFEFAGDKIKRVVDYW
jgi:ketosteroid isomerase-like protein